MANNKVDFSKIINDLFDSENYSEARRLILNQLRKNPQDHWLLTRLATTYYEERKYKKALEISIRAINISPECPLCLWDYAGALEMTGNETEAIKIWEQISSTNLEKLANDQCGEGLTRAKALQMDSFFRMGVTYATLGNLEKSQKAFNNHLNKRYPGNRSIYTLKYVNEQIAKLGS